MSYGLIELTFVFAVVLALGLWELFKIRRRLFADAKARMRRGRAPFSAASHMRIKE